MKIHGRLEGEGWRLVRVVSPGWLELVADAYKKAGAEDVACMQKDYGLDIPPLEKEYTVYVRGSFDIKKLEERIFN